MTSRRPSAPSGFFSLFVRLLHSDAGAGLVLLFAALVALFWANSPWGASYHDLWELPLGLNVGGFDLRQSLHFWINDGLMAVFFLLVGLEIRHEMHDGALSTARRASLPLIAALGGVIAPALIYIVFSAPESRAGWAVPTATDIAFAVGMLALLGNRVPPALRILLLAVAVIDDIVAVLVIALFYSDGIALGGMAIAAAGVAVILIMQRLNIERALFYVAPGAIVWAGLLYAGVHPALAGVMLGLITPIASSRQDGPSPVSELQAGLHPWVTFGIMPLFALANAGVHLGSLNWNPVTTSVFTGIALGLFVGKPIGILAATALCVKLRLCELPAGVTLKSVFVVGCLGGIGFTMSIFISELAFDQEALLAMARFAVLTASALAAAAGLFAGWRLLRQRAA